MHVLPLVKAIVMESSLCDSEWWPFWFLAVDSALPWPVAQIYQPQNFVFPVKILGPLMSVTIVTMLGQPDLSGPTTGASGKRLRIFVTITFTWARRASPKKNRALQPWGSLHTTRLEPPVAWLGQKITQAPSKGHWIHWICKHDHRLRESWHNCCSTRFLRLARMLPPWNSSISCCDRKPKLNQKLFHLHLQTSSKLTISTPPCMEFPLVKSRYPVCKIEALNHASRCGCGPAFT